jgi:hypothetical protein
MADKKSKSIPITCIMLPRVFFFLCWILLFRFAGAQTDTRYRDTNTYEGVTGIGNKQFTAALSWAHLHSFGKKKRLKAGYGIRFTSYAGKNQDFITAPARLTSRQTGPQVLFSKTYNESLDTVSFSTAQVNMLNLVIHLEYALHRKIDFGFNIDAFGLSFGARQQGRLRSSIKPAQLSIEQSGKPTTLNALLVSDNDIGSLNSELYIRYWINATTAVKAGYGFLFAEYTTDNKLIFDNDRFRNKVSLAVVGISYNPFRKQN